MDQWLPSFFIQGEAEAGRVHFAGIFVFPGIAVKNDPVLCMHAENVEAAREGLIKDMVHAEFPGAPFFRIQIPVAIPGRIELVHIGRHEEFLVIQVVVGLFILFVTERNTGARVGAEFGVPVHAYAGGYIPTVGQVDFVLQVEGQVMDFLSIGDGFIRIAQGEIMVLRNFILVPVHTACDRIHFILPGELVGNTTGLHAHAPAGGPPGIAAHGTGSAGQIVIVFESGLISINRELIFPVVINFLIVLEADMVVVFFAFVRIEGISTV